MRILIKSYRKKLSQMLGPPTELSSDMTGQWQNGSNYVVQPKVVTKQLTFPR